MTDVELHALTAMLERENILLAADNEQRLRYGFSPAWTSDCKPSEVASALVGELALRGILRANQ